MPQMNEEVARQMMLGDRVEVERIGGYYVVWSTINRSHSIWKDGQYMATAKVGMLTSTLRELEGMARTHKLTLWQRFEEWLANMPLRRAERLFKRAYFSIFAVWMAFAVCLFITPLIL